MAQTAACVREIWLIIRTQARDPFDVVQFGEWMLEHHQLNKLDTDVWAFLEQLGMAAAELGNQDLAEVREH